MLKEKLEEVKTVKREIRQLQSNLRISEMYLIEGMIKEGYIDCLTVNYTALSYRLNNK